MSVRPTKKQQELLTFISEFIEQNSYSPSYREIQAGSNYNSVATVAKHVQNLIARGHLRKRENSARSLEVVGATDNTDSSGSQGQTHEQWLCGRIEGLLNNPKSNADDLYVLIGTLKVLGFDSSFKTYAARLRDL